MPMSRATNSVTQEVLSVPAGESFSFIAAYHVHAHPARPRNYHYRRTDFITFRRRGGVMDVLFAITHRFDMRPNDDAALQQQPLTDTERERVHRYIAARTAGWEFEHPDEPYCFYVLSDTANIALPHAPRTRTPGLRGGCYFTLGELRSGKPIVDVASRAR